MPETNGGPKIGVYICDCGINIAGKVDVPATVEFANDLPFVTVAREYKFMCSDPGQDLIVDDLKSGLVDRVVVASCSPLMHEETFRTATEVGGVNPYFFQMANIREHVSWVTEDPNAATEKAKALVAGAVRRIAFHSALIPKKSPVNPNALVVGGGIAGIHAALKLAEAGKKVYLVEREATIGGHMAMFDKTFPTLDCSACILTPKMSAVKANPNIELLSYSEVESVDGYVGNFQVNIKRKSRHVDEKDCTGCGDCVSNCPVTNQTFIPDPMRIEPEVDPKIKTIVDTFIGGMNGQSNRALLPTLLEVNRQCRYLPQDALQYVSWKLDVPMSEITRLATFYNVFSLEPRGEHTISVCMGTACFVAGADKLMDELESKLNIPVGGTTSDKQFSLLGVRCLGCCALAPAIRIDNDTFAHVKRDQVADILSKYAPVGSGVS